nr:immunoglobulin light chain junction region [Macaca mulatta]
CMQALEFPLTL